MRNNVTTGNASLRLTEHSGILAQRIVGQIQLVLPKTPLQLALEKALKGEIEECSPEERTLVEDWIENGSPQP